MEGTPTLEQLMMKNDYAILYNPKLCTSTSNDSGYNISVDYTNIRGYHDVSKIFTQIMKKAIQAIRELWKVRCVICLDNLLILY
jgi:hypothetical protein